MAHATPDPQRGGCRQVRLLGGLELQPPSAKKRPSERALLLFARLVLQPMQLHSRDELGAWLWPEPRDAKGQLVPDPITWRREELSRRRSDLRLWLQRPGLPPGLDFIGGRSTLQLNPAAFQTDVQALHQAWASGDPGPAQLPPLLPELQDAWLDSQRTALAAAHAAARSGQAWPAQPARASVFLPYPDTFFGRQAEVEQLRALLASGAQLIVVQGPAGVGKTRLVAQALAQPPAGLAQQPWLVPLARLRPAHDPQAARERLHEVLRDTLQIQPDRETALEQLVTRLSDQPACLVLDNFEQFVDSGAEVGLGDLLQRLPRLKVLLTSTRGLPGRPDVRHETLHLGGLPLPLPGASLTELRDNPAAQLYLDRATSVMPDYKLTVRNRASLIEACRALEGLPLSIEWAAAKARSLPPHKVAATLSSRPQAFARSQARARQEPRHGSLQSLADWAWSLLDKERRRGLIELSVFGESFTATQAQAVLQRADVTQLQPSLQQDSVLQCEAGAAGLPRWRLPYVMQVGLKRRLQRAAWGAVAASARQRHMDLFLQQLLAREPPYDAADLPEYRAAVLQLLADIQAGSSGAAAKETVDRVAGALLRLARHAERLGADGDCLDVFEQALTQLPIAHPGHEQLRLLVPRLLLAHGQAARAAVAADRALAQARNTPGSRGAALWVHTQVRWLSDQNAADALTPALQALDGLSQGAADEGWAQELAAALVLVGALTLMRTGNHRSARSYFEKAKRISRRQGDERGMLHARAGVVACLLVGRRFAATVKLARACDARAQVLRDVPLRLKLLNRIAEGLAELGRWTDALAVGQELVRLARSHGSRYHISYGLWGQCLPLARLAEAATDEADQTAHAAKAAKLMGFARAYWERHFEPLTADNEADVAHVRDVVTPLLRYAGWRHHHERGQRLDEDEGVRLGSG